MYLVRIFDGPEDTTGTVIHSPFSDEAKVSSGKVNQVLNAVSDFNFTINLNNPAWDSIEPLRTLVKVKDLRLNETIFDGRVLQPNGKMSEVGMFHKGFTCECKLGYLQDSLQRHKEVRNTTVRGFFEIMIDVHNSQVEPHKRFKVGNVTVSNTTDNVYRYLGYESTFASIKDKLIDRLGGFIVVREEADGTYLDYLETVGKDVSEKPIKLTHNLKSMSYDINPTEVITRLVPLGERIESEDEEAVDASQARLTIESVNNGIDYLDDIEMQKEFGIIVKEMIWDDVTTPQRLKSNGLRFLENQKAASVSYTVNSANTELLEEEILAFKIGNRYPLINPILTVNEYVQVIEKGIDILNPYMSDLKIGDKHRTLSQYQAAANKRSQIVADLESRVESQNRIISTIKSEVVDVESGLKKIQQVLEDSDLEELPKAINTLEQAVISLNQALDDIPVYGVATQTINGLMAFLDKIKLDYITISQNINLDNLKSKLDLITVSKSVNIDDIITRLENLES